MNAMINIIKENNKFEAKPQMYNSRLVDPRKKVLSRFSMFDGVGLDLTECNSYDEALLNAGLDYTANKEPIYLADGTKVEDFFASVKSDDLHSVLGIVGNQYTAVSNRDAFSIAEEIVNEGAARYEVGGPALGSQNCLNYSRSFLVLRGDDFNIEDDVYNSFIVFNNSFDGSTGLSYQVICQRLVCLNGLVRYLGGKKNQLQIRIQHSKTAMDRIQMANKIIKQRLQEITLIKQEAQLFIGQTMSKDQFIKEIIPLVLKEKKVVENDKERQRGRERIDNMVMQLMSAYDAEDTQNYNGTAYKVLLALSDWETHAAPLRDSGNGQLYMNRVLKGMLTTTAVAKYIAESRGLMMR